MNLNDLNPQQKEAVLNSYDMDTLLLAGAGSGKTKVITSRVGYLIEDRNVDPSDIMMLTFTNKAAKEMKERLEHANVNMQGMWSGTFHSVCVRILKRFGKRIGLDTFTIIDTTDSKSVMVETLNNLGMASDAEAVKYYLGRISKNKNNFIRPKEILDSYCETHDYKEKLEGEVYKEYQEVCWRKKYLDFDDLLIYTIVLLRNDAQTRDWFHQNVHYILCDEAQDSNKCQIMILKLLQGQYTNVFCVGDVDQSIYGFRNARPEYFVEFDKLFPVSKVMKLEQNYRSTQTIISASNNVIGNNNFRLDKQVFTANEKGQRIRFKQCPTNNDEGLFVSKEVQYLNQVEQIVYSDMAVLYRTNDQSRAIEDALLTMGIPYHIVGGIGFYNRKEIKDVMAFLRLMNNPNDEVAFKRVMKQQKGVGDKTVIELINTAKANSLDLITIMGAVTEPKRVLPALRKTYDVFSQGAMDVFEFMTYVVKEMDMIGKLHMEGTDEAAVRADNIAELLSIAKENEKMPLGDFVDQIALSTKEEVDDDPDSVTLMTIHSAKGLEFKVVFVVGVEENILPHSNSKGSLKDTEEERRLMYVAMTRAKKVLYLTCAEYRRRFDKNVNNDVSRFFGEIDDKHIEKL